MEKNNNYFFRHSTTLFEVNIFVRLVYDRLKMFMLKKYKKNNTGKVLIEHKVYICVKQTYNSPFRRQSELKKVKFL